MAISSVSEIDTEQSKGSIDFIFSHSNFALNNAGWLGAISSSNLIELLGEIGAWGLVIALSINASISNFFQRKGILLFLISIVIGVASSLIGYSINSQYGGFVGETVCRPILSESGILGLYFIILITISIISILIYKITKTNKPIT